MKRKLAALLERPSVRRAAAEVERQLRPLLGKRTVMAELVLRRNGEEEVIPIPRVALRSFRNLFRYVATGTPFQVIPQHLELSTQEVAELLGVSRPTVVAMLERGEIPYHVFGTHRRIRLDDVRKYQRRQQAAAARAAARAAAGK